MDDFLKQLLVLSPLVVYGILFLSAFLENVIPPIPGDTVVVFAAYLVGIRYLDYIPVAVATTAGSWLGFMTLYFLGLHSGRKFLSQNNSRLFPRERLLRVESWFGRYGYFLILANRFLSGVRSVISLFSGIARLPWPKVALAALFSCLVWNLLLITAGYYLGQNWRQVLSLIEKYNVVVLTLVGLLLLIYFFRRRRPGGARVHPE